MRHVVGSAPRPPDRVRTITGTPIRLNITGYKEPCCLEPVSNAETIFPDRCSIFKGGTRRVNQRDQVPRPSCSNRVQEREETKALKYRRCKQFGARDIKIDIDGATYEWDASVNSSPGSYRSWFL